MNRLDVRQGRPDDLYFSPFTDTQRLDFMIKHEAYIAWTREGDDCRVFVRNEEGDTGPFLGWPCAYSNSARSAIDACLIFELDKKEDHVPRTTS